MFWPLQWQQMWGLEMFHGLLRNSMTRVKGSTFLIRVRDGAAPVALAQVLDATGREFVEDPATFMLLDDEEWGMVLEHGDTVRPYMDERLQKDTVLYSQFV